jgi:hypothetical protein
VRYTLGKRYVERGDQKWWEYLVLDSFTEMVFGVPKVICACSEEKDAQASAPSLASISIIYFFSAVNLAHASARLCESSFG